MDGQNSCYSPAIIQKHTIFMRLCAKSGHILFMQADTLRKPIGIHVTQGIEIEPVKLIRRLK